MSCCWSPTDTSRSARPARKPDAWGPTDRLAATERDEVGARGHEAAQVAPRRQVHRCVDEDRQVVRVGRGDEVLDRQAIGLGQGVIEGTGRRGPDRGLHVGDRRTADGAVPADALDALTAELDEARARRPNEVVVRVAMRGLDDDLGRRGPRVGQAFHEVRVEPGEHRRRTEGQPGRCARRDVACLGPGQGRESGGSRPPAGRAIRTKDSAAAAIAATTSGSIKVPPASVAQPRALMSVRTPRSS